MLRSFRFSLSFALLAFITSLLLLTWLLLSLISFKTAGKDLFAQKTEEAQVLLASIISIVPGHISSLNEKSPAAILAGKLSREKDFAGLRVVDSRGETVYSLADSKDADPGLRDALRTGKESLHFSRDGSIIFRYAPIYNNGEIAGAARLALSLFGEHERLNRSRHIFLAYFILDFILLLTFGSFLLSRIVVIPIKKLLAATEQIAAGDYSQSVNVPGSKEIAELAESFNAMQAALRSKQEEAETHMKSLEKANNDLNAAREETIRTEKMASVGLLAAGTAHEIGTPSSKRWVASTMPKPTTTLQISSANFSQRLSGMRALARSRPNGQFERGRSKFRIRAAKSWKKSRLAGVETSLTAPSKKTSVPQRSP